MKSLQNRKAGGTFMIKAIRLAQKGLKQKQGGPFGAVVVKAGQVVGRGCNQVTSRNDPTAHAEIVAIRQACRRLNTFDLSGCQIYTSCEPCPMCLAAIYWARLDKIYWAGTRRDAARAGFDDEFIYRELCLPPRRRKIPVVALGRKEAQKLFAAWRMMPNKVLY
jgi:tRNA(Arg) A34 adenosine deaminase TadA